MTRREIKPGMLFHSINVDGSCTYWFVIASWNASSTMIITKYLTTCSATKMISEYCGNHRDTVWDETELLQDCQS